MPPVWRMLRDVAMDLSILLTTQLCFGRIKLGRLLWALMCMQLSTLAYILIGDVAREPMALLLSLISAAYFVNPTGQPKGFALAAASILLCCVSAAGLMALLGNGFRFYPAFAAFLLTLSLLRSRLHIRYRWNIEVLAESCGHRLCFRALIDTGNRLREPLSGLPVLIVDSNLIPPDFFQAKHARLLRFGVLGSSGEIPAYRAERVRIRLPNGSYRAAPECYIAVFPGKIPGSIQALAPPEFTEAFDPLPTTTQRRNVRRYPHAVFKHSTINLWTGRTDSQRLRLLHRRKRSAAAATDAGRRNVADAQNQRRRYERSFDHD